MEMTRILLLTGVQRGVSKGVKDGRRLPALPAATPVGGDPCGWPPLQAATPLMAIRLFQGWPACKA
jgi:hypothetical protein